MITDRLRQFSKRYERALVPGLLILGFIVDVVTFRSLKISTTFMLLGVHATLAGLGIMYINIHDGKQPPPKSAVLGYVRFVAPLLVQFTFGALLSSALIFYWFSGAFAASWPIMALLILLMGSNEVFRKIYLRPFVQVAVYAFALFSYFSLMFPFVFRSLSPVVFVMGGAVSTTIVLLGILFIGRFTERFKQERKWMMFATVFVFAGMNALYFLNIIPPIPLSIRDAGIYHDVQAVGSEYTLTGEDETFLDNILPGQTVHGTAEDRVYAYTAIFAPADLTTRIYHRWERFDEADGRWIATDRPSFSIRGGRDDGYRGYTFKSRLTPGKWRVTVETERGQVLGRIPFTFVTE